MLRKKHIILKNVLIRNIKHKVILNRTKPGDFMCNTSKCIYRDNCDYWILPKKRGRISNFCITYPRTSETIKTRHYYYPNVVEKIL